MRRVENKIDKGESGAQIVRILKGMVEFRPHVGSEGLSKVVEQEGSCLQSHAVGFLIWEPCVGWFEGGKKEAERLGRKLLQGLGWSLWEWKKKGMSGCMDQMDGPQRS